MRSSWLRAVALAAAAVPCLATSMASHGRSYPTWHLHGLPDGAMQVGCAPARAWVSKSGKRGVGVSLELAAGAAGASCEVAIARAVLTAGHDRIEASAAAPVVAGAATVRLYLPFAFDNQAGWNAGMRTGTLDLWVTVDGVAQPVRHFTLSHDWPAPHEDVGRGRRAQ